MEAVQEQLALRILVDKVKNRVLFAEADTDFVDILLSFLTLPLGTVVRLIRKPSSSESRMVIGSLNTLYEGLESLDAKYLWTEACKVMLLQPRNSSEAQCQKLKMNIDDTEPTRYFLCKDCSPKYGSFLSTYENVRCSCGGLMNRKICLKDGNVSVGEKIGGEVFVVGTATFIISDDLNVMPNVPGTGIALLDKLGVRDTNALEERTINITLTEILNLLKWSLLSKTPLTDLFLRKNHYIDKLKSEPSSIAQYQNPEETTAGSRKMTVKLMLRKSSNIVLFAQAAEDFIDFLFSFLTIPLGNVVNLLGLNSSLASIDNLYQSMSVLDVHKYLRTQDLKNSLLQPSLAPQFLCENQVLPVSEACNPTLYFYDKLTTEGRVAHLTAKMWPTSSKYDYSGGLTHRNPKSPIAESTGRGGFVRGPAMFMVTDDLIVTPSSTISAICFLNRLKIPLSDLEERVVSIGKNEALSILKASLHSSSALTNGLNLVLKKPKQES